MTATKKTPNEATKPAGESTAKAPVVESGKATAPKPDKSKRQALKVTALGERFRRANLEFSRKPRLICLDDLSEAQVKAIQAEPRLSVVEVELDVELDAEE